MILVGRQSGEGFERFSQPGVAHVHRFGQVLQINFPPNIFQQAAFYFFDEFFRFLFKPLRWVRAYTEASICTAMAEITC